MRSSFAARTGLQLTRTPNYRRQAMRRRLAVIAAVVGLALVSSVVGMMSSPSRELAAVEPVQTGPFSYFPSE